MFRFIQKVLLSDIQTLLYGHNYWHLDTQEGAYNIIFLINGLLNLFKEERGIETQAS